MTGSVLCFESAEQFRLIWPEAPPWLIHIAVPAPALWTGASHRTAIGIMISFQLWPLSGLA